MLVEKNNVYTLQCDYCISIKNNVSSNNPYIIKDVCEIIEDYLSISKSVVSYTNIYNVSIRMCQEHYLYEKMKRINANNRMKDTEDWNQGNNVKCYICGDDIPKHKQKQSQIYFGHCFECFLELIGE